MNTRTPPRFRKLVLVGAAVLLLAIGLVAGSADYSAAQTTPLIDYDLDDDNLIEVRTRDQFQAIHHDMDGDGSPTTLNSGGYTTSKTWAESFPNAMPNAGCPLRDHDNDANTANERKCIGYELIADVNFSGQTYVPFGKDGVWGAVNMTAKIVGNGFRVMNASRGTQDNAVLYGVIGVVGEGATVEGLGVINPRFGVGRTNAGGITGELKGTITGSYTKNGSTRQGGHIGGLAGSLNTGTGYAGKIAHSYVLGGSIGRRAQGLGGLIGTWNANTGTNVGQCINSYFSGTIDHGGLFPKHGLIAGQKFGGTITNCVGDNTTDSGVSKAWENSSSSENSSYTASKANMVAVTDYDTPATNNPFSNWDDYDAAGVALASGATRTDFWYFGDSTTFPVLKGWGHDHTEAMARSQSGSQTVNLCTRTLAVANEIIRLLKDNDRAPGVTTTPAAVTALTDCTAASDTRNVSITNLTNLVVTSETNPLNLNPDRTSPASAKLTALDMNDFAYLTNATHFNLSGNSFTTLPPRLFQGVPLRWLDLSDNALTTIPADLFAGMGTVTATTGNMLLLNGNSLTYTGIADRVFDPLTYLNGLDLSDNSLTRVNTRWFEDLANLGRRPATGAAFRDKLGLHLAGNTITEHYYSTKIFTGVRENVVTYTGATAGDTLRTAIKAAIAEAAGGTTPTTLDLDSTDHFDNRATPPAYLGSADTCPTTGTAGPADLAYLSGVTPDCYVSPKWSPPYVTGATTAAPTAPTVTQWPTILTVNASHTASANFSAYQMRYRATPANPSDAWTGDWFALPISLASGTKSTAVSGLTANTSYQFQMRALSRTGPPSSAVAASAMTLSAPAAPTGLSAATSTTSAAAVELTWTGLGINPGSETKYQHRSKLSTAQAYGNWADITASDHSTVSYTLGGLTSGSQYDIQIRLHWSDAVGASAASAAAMATASGVPTPTGFTASPGATTGSINLSWTAVPGATGYQFRCNPAGTGCTDTWQSAGTGTTHTATGLTGGETYSLELRALLTGSPESAAATVSARAQTQPPPRNLSANVGSIPGELTVTWIAPLSGAVSQYDYRYKQSSAADSTFTAWTRVPDANNNNDYTDDLSLDLTGLLGATSYVVQLRVVLTGGEMSLEQHVSHTTSPVPAPRDFAATTGTGPGEVDLSWDAPTGITVLRYEVRSRHGTGDWSRWNAVGTVTTYTYSGLVGGASHTIQLRTVMTGAGPSAAVSATSTAPVVPPPATFSAATSVFPGEINIEWSAVTNATSYEIRTKATTENWPSGNTWTTVPGTWTSAIVYNLAPGVAHNVELRAVVDGVGKSTVEETQATSGSAEVTGTATLPDGYAIDTATLPGRIAITLPGSEDPFIFRTRTANPGEWSRWQTVRPAASQLLYEITGLDGGVEYDVELRVYRGMTDGFTTALTAQVEALALEAPADFEVTVASGTLVMRWTNPNSVDADGYQYRRRATGTGTAAEWSDWVSLRHEGDRDAQQQHFITDLESGVSYQFELKILTQAGESPVASASATSRLRLPELASILPEVREVTIKAGDDIRLGVNLYKLQGDLDNTVPTGGSNTVVFRWMEVGPGGGSFADPGNGRQVIYTAPSSPGTYTVTAEAQPDGVCDSHHAEATAISAANRAPCIATFTIRVTRAPGTADQQPEPVNPTGVIPTELTDNAGTAYTVFTPVDGGTFTGDDVTVSAAAGAVPDRTLLGVTAAVSALPPPIPIPGASMSVAGNYYDVNAIQQSGQAPLTDYTLDDPLTVCLPFPQEFRADLSNVVAVERKPDGGISILTTKVRTNAGNLTVCGTLSQLPATVAVAKLGTVPAIPPTPTPEQDLPDTGATTPGYAVLLLTLLTGALVLTGMYRIRRIIL